MAQARRTTPSSRPPLHRMQQILQLLHDRRKVTAQSVADALEVSERTARRDLRYMQDMLGVPLEFNVSQKTFRLTGHEGNPAAGLQPGSRLK